MEAIGFMDMPAEVRNMIYEHLFKGSIIEDRGLSPHPIKTDNYYPAITQTNRQIRTESLPVLNQSTTFHFRCGQPEATPVPVHVLRQIKTVRLPAHRLKTFDTSSFTSLETLVLDVSIAPATWRLYQDSRNSSKGDHTDISDIVSLGMTLGLFDDTWGLARIWRDEERQFRILCWFSSWVREDQERQPILVDMDSGMILEEPPTRLPAPEA